jgi:hypothetical protein
MCVEPLLVDEDSVDVQHPALRRLALDNDDRHWRFALGIDGVDAYASLVVVKARPAAEIHHVLFAFI